MFNLAELFCFIGSTVFLFNREPVDERGERERESTVGNYTPYTCNLGGGVSRSPSRLLYNQ